MIKMSCPRPIGVIKSFHHFLYSVLNTHRHRTPLPRKIEHSSVKMTFDHSSYDQSLCAKANSRRCLACCAVRRGLFLEIHLEMPYQRSILRIVRSETSRPVFSRIFAYEISGFLLTSRSTCLSSRSERRLGRPVRALRSMRGFLITLRIVESG